MLQGCAKKPNFGGMEYKNSLESLLCDAYIMEALFTHQTEGITRDEIIAGWQQFCRERGAKCALSRQTFIRHKKTLESFGLKIRCGEGYRYRLSNRRQISHNPLLSSTMECVLELLFSTRYRKLGKAVTPRSMTTGSLLLFGLADAIEQGVKVRVRYEPFGREGYEAVLHPYCLRADQDRWYVLAYKEDNTHGLPAQVFALDRMKDIQLTQDPYPEPTAIDPLTYFDNAFGVFVGGEYPPQHVTLLADRTVSDYLTTLPLHHSQTLPVEQPDGRYLFRLHLSITPDFTGALMRWGDHLEVIEPPTLRHEISQKLHAAAARYEEEGE